MAPGFSVPNYFCRKATIRIADIMRRRASGSIVFEVPPSNLLQTTAERGLLRGNDTRTGTPSEPHGGIRLPGESQGAQSQSQSLVISSVTPAFFRHRSSREAVRPWRVVGVGVNSTSAVGLVRRGTWNHMTDTHAILARNVSSGQIGTKIPIVLQ